MEPSSNSEMVDLPQESFLELLTCWMLVFLHRSVRMIMITKLMDLSYGRKRADYCWLYACKEKSSSCDLIHHSLTLQLEPKTNSFSLCRQVWAPTVGWITEVGRFSPILLISSFRVCFRCVPGSDLARCRVALRKPVFSEAISAAGNSQERKGVASDPEERDLKGWNEITHYIHKC